MITTEKKRYSCLSGGCAINYDRKKKIQSSVCWVRGSGDYDRKKKDTVVCLAGCSVCCISFWFWREIGSFFVVAGNFHYDRKKKKIQSSVWRVRDHYYYRKKRYSCLSDGCTVLAITTGKKKDTVVCLVGCAVVLCQFFVLAGNWQFFCCGGKFLLRPEKKRYSHLSGGCAIIITTRKKRDSCLSGGLCCCIVSVFGSGGKLAVFLLRQEIFITPGNAFFCSGGKF